MNRARTEAEKLELVETRLDRDDARLALQDARRARGRGWNAADADDAGDPASLRFE